MFKLINRRVEDLSPGTAVEEKGKKKKIQQALAPIANRKKNRTNKQTIGMGIR